VPLFASKDYKGKSKRGLYGDVVEELDWSVGEILKTLKDLKIDNNTLVIFSSDNGPWLTQNEKGGSAGLLFEGKGSSWEGGTRVPMIARWPGVIKPNQTTGALATTMDLLPTITNFPALNYLVRN
jgi:arylsulfatase